MRVAKYYFRFLLLWVLSLQGGHGLFAQEFREGNTLISVGYGFPNLQKSVLRLLSDNPDFRTRGFGPLHLRFELGTGKLWSMGGSVNVAGYGASWLDSGYSASLNVISYSGLFRVNYYLLNEENMQLYLGMGAGYRSRISQYQNNRPGAFSSDVIESVISEVAFPVGFESTLGLRRKFSPGFGAYAEFGLAKSAIQAGVYLLF